MSNTAVLPSTETVAPEPKPKKGWTKPTITSIKHGDAAVLHSNLIDVRTGPTPQQTDDIIAEFDIAQRVKAAASETERDAKQTLTSLLRSFGVPKPESEHSWIIRGELHSAMLTDVTTTTLNEEKILAVKMLLADAGHVDVFYRLFSPRIKHELVGGADQALLTADMPNHLRKKLKAAFAECLRVTNSAPRIKVDLLVKEPKQPRKRAAKKTAVRV